MNKGTVLKRLKAAFPDLYQEKQDYHTISFRWGATVFIRKANLDIARIKNTAYHYFPNGTELRAYLQSQKVSIDSSIAYPDYLIGPEHIDEVIAILQD